MLLQLRERELALKLSDMEAVERKSEVFNIMKCYSNEPFSLWGLVVLRWSILHSLDC